MTERSAEGADLSSLTFNEAVSVERPASLVQEPLKSVPEVSVVWNWSAVQVTPLMVSTPYVWTVTSLHRLPSADLNVLRWLVNACG